MTDTPKGESLETDSKAAGDDYMQRKVLYLITEAYTRISYSANVADDINRIVAR